MKKEGGTQSSKKKGGRRQMAATEHSEPRMWKVRVPLCLRKEEKRKPHNTGKRAQNQPQICRSARTTEIQPGSTAADSDFAPQGETRAGQLLAGF